VKVDFATQEVIFHMGLDMPSKSEILADGIPYFGHDLFSFQHAPQLLPNGDLMLYDNGNRRGGVVQTPESGISKAIQLSFSDGDPATSASISWEWTLPSYNNAQGDADRLPNGNTLVSSRVGSAIYEVDSLGIELWRVEVVPSGAYVLSLYRAERIDSILVDSPGDSDADGLADMADNCPDHANPSQIDTDGDGFGDVCAFALGLAMPCAGNSGPDARWEVDDATTPVGLFMGITVVVDDGVTRRTAIDEVAPAGSFAELVGSCAAAVGPVARIEKLHLATRGGIFAEGEDPLTEISLQVELDSWALEYAYAPAIQLECCEEEPFESAPTSASIAGRFSVAGTEFAIGEEGSCSDGDGRTCTINAQVLSLLPDQGASLRQPRLSWEGPAGTNFSPLEHYLEVQTDGVTYELYFEPSFRSELEFQPAPEPSTALLQAAASAAIVALARRRRSSRQGRPNE
jgi:hypothetical protein